MAATWAAASIVAEGFSAAPARAISTAVWEKTGSITNSSCMTSSARPETGSTPKSSISSKNIPTLTADSFFPKVTGVVVSTVRGGVGAGGAEIIAGSVMKVSASRAAASIAAWAASASV